MLPSAKHAESTRTKKVWFFAACAVVMQSYGCAFPLPHHHWLTPCAQQASKSAAEQHVDLPFLRNGGLPSSPPTAKAAPSPAGASPPSLLPHSAHESPSPTASRASGYIRADKKKAE